MDIAQQEGQLDLTLIMMESNSSLTGAFKYNTDLFDKQTIERMVGHFQTLLAAIVTHSEEKISQLSLLTDREQHQLLVEWNDTARDYPQDRCIHQLFETQVEKTPDALALVDGNQSFTYQELNHKANQLAHYLQEMGVKPETLVGVCVDRSSTTIVSLLGILKAGGAYLPVDPTYPTERLNYILRDAQIKVLLTQQHLLDVLPDIQAEVVSWDGSEELLGTYPTNNPISRVKPDNLVYVIYTSGSTGKPKGVEIIHQGLCNLILSQKKGLGLQPDSQFLHINSFSFDAATYHLFRVLCSGATLHLAPTQTIGDELIQVLEDKSITDASFPVPLLASLPLAELPRLRNITVGAQECPWEVVEKWAKGRKLFNIYGPTEATICTTVADISDRSKKPTIGRPIPNTQVYILDRHLQPVPVGIPGEIYIGGVGLARGYLNRPELTESRFIDNPFNHGKLYKTGDLARYLIDGEIVFLGRLDNQIKIRGFRIELGEIEYVLQSHPSVQPSLVVTRKDSLGNIRLVAYFLSQQLDGEQVRDFLKQQLPEYLIPSAFIRLKAFPLTPNGKVYLHALPDPDWQQQQRQDLVSPRTPTEETIARIFSSVLDSKHISIHDNFFELGGHSLLATQVVSRLRSTFQIDLPLRCLFTSPTVAKLSELIEISIAEKLELEDTKLIEQILAEVEDLSESEVKLQLFDGE